MVYNTLTIAGVDPSGGAGVLADVKTMSALGTFACAVIAALTAQNTQAVTGVFPVSPDFVRQQLKTLFDDVTIHGVKIGMLANAKVIETVAEEIARYRPPYTILDPVMVAKSGDVLVPEEAIPTLIEALIPLSTMITPNLPEAAILIRQRHAENLSDMYKTAEKLFKLIESSDERWVLLKGGHLPSDDTVDLLFNGDKMIELPGSRIHTKNTHGTGCTFSSAICALAVQRQDIPNATQQAKDYLIQAINHADLLNVGQGHGPLHHFYHWWQTA